MSSTESATQASGGHVVTTAGPHAARKKESLIKRLINKIRAILGRKKAATPAPRPETPVFVGGAPQMTVQEDGAHGGAPVLPAVGR